MYVNGVRGANGPLGGDLSAWDPSMRLALGNEFTLDRPWHGSIHLVAIYDRALSAQEIQQNFQAGADPVGEEPLVGDLNDDGVVNEADLCLWHGNPVDLNGDGAVNDADAVYLIGLMDTPPVDCNENLVPDACETVSESVILTPWDDPPANFYEPAAAKGDFAIIGSYLDDVVAARTPARRTSSATSATTGSPTARLSPSTPRRATSTATRWTSTATWRSSRR